VITSRDIMKTETKNVPADATMKESWGAIWASCCYCFLRIGLPCPSCIYNLRSFCNLHDSLFCQKGSNKYVRSTETTNMYFCHAFGTLRDPFCVQKKCNTKGISGSSPVKYKMKIHIVSCFTYHIKLYGFYFYK
jgi:hypothetical protein